MFYKITQENMFDLQALKLALIRKDHLDFKIRGKDIDEKLFYPLSSKTKKEILEIKKVYKQFNFDYRLDYYINSIGLIAEKGYKFFVEYVSAKKNYKLTENSIKNYSPKFRPTLIKMMKRRDIKHHIRFGYVETHKMITVYLDDVEQFKVNGTLSDQSSFTITCFLNGWPNWVNKLPQLVRILAK